MFRVAKKMSSTNQLATAFLLLTVATAATALKCWRCGQYSDGIGSITPCTNRSAARVVECPSNAKYCIKYVSEMTIVRDCVPTCSEKEFWGARTFCCSRDACNTGAAPAPLAAAICAAALVLYATR